MKNRIFIAIVGLLALCSCHNSQNGNTAGSVERQPDSVVSNNGPDSNADTKTGTVENPQAFDISTIPVSDKQIGTFPYFKLPPGYEFTDPNKYHGTGEIKDYDKEYFYNHGKYTPAEGKTYKAVIRVVDNKKFSKLELQKSFDDLINQLGGVKINNSEPIQKEEKDRLEKTDPQAYTNGYLHSCINWEDVNTYIIRTPEKVLWVQYNLGSDDANITVLETKAFKNEMSTVSASEIKRQLDADGKVILYINFDTDAATLTTDGKKEVDEISTVMKDNKDLKLSVEGHTDNTGSVAHNKTLSLQRAQTVVGELVKGNTSPARLHAEGFGSEKPLASNDSEPNKAKNRRVELIKM